MKLPLIILYHSLFLRHSTSEALPTDEHSPQEILFNNKAFPILLIFAIMIYKASPLLKILYEDINDSSEDDDDSDSEDEDPLAEENKQLNETIIAIVHSVFRRFSYLGRNTVNSLEDGLDEEVVMNSAPS